MTFKDFFLENRDERIFAQLAQQIDNTYYELYEENLSRFDKTINICLYTLWKHFDYSISVLSSQKISKKNADYNFIRSKIFNMTQNGIAMETIDKVLNAMAYMGILVVEEEEYNPEKSLFGIKDILISISEKNIQTLEEYKSKRGEASYFALFSQKSEEEELIDSYVRNIIHFLQR